MIGNPPEPAFPKMALQHIGLIGSGLLGSAIAERLIGAGFAVHGFDPDESRQTHLSRLGGIVEHSARHVARRCGRLILSLPDSSVAGNVLQKIDSALLPAATIMDTTTGAPDDAVRFGAKLAARGRFYLDTTVGGSSDQV